MIPALRHAKRRSLRLARRARQAPERLALARKGVYRRKVFCVGRNKTGTTTLEAVLRHYLFRVGPQVEAETLVHAGKGRLTPEFWAWVDRWEAFQDLPFSGTWALPQIYERYPNALYILTVRAPEEWFKSLVNHHFSLWGLPHDAPRAAVARALRGSPEIGPGFRNWNHRLQFEIVDDEQLYDKERYIENLRAHNSAVRVLIPAEQLLEIDLSEHTTTAELCRFLGIPAGRVAPMPRQNRRR